MKLQLIILLISFSAFAFDSFVPQKFITQNGTAVFTDFQSARYVLEFGTKNISITSKIRFKQTELGFPIIDLVPNLDEFLIRQNEKSICSHKKNKTIHIPLQTMNEYKLVESNAIAFDCILKPGIYELNIKHTLKSEGELGFWYTDRYPRDLLEKYLPTNLEYDQYKSTIVLKNLNSNLKIISNGKIQGRINKTIDFPDYYNSSSIYLHIINPVNYSFKEDYYEDSSGRKIKIQTYQKSPKEKLYLSNEKIIKNTKSHLKTLESMMGPWPHDKIIVYQNQLIGGMEYPGAIYTSSLYLGHELFHNYFARGVFPSDGNAGWIDEGLAVWYDSKQLHKKSTLATYVIQDKLAKLKNHYTQKKIGKISPYNRTTHKGSYVRGFQFFKKIDEDSKNKLSSFLKYFFNKYKHQIYSEQIFVKELKNYFSDIEINKLLYKYIYNS